MTRRASPASDPPRLRRARISSVRDDQGSVLPLILVFLTIGIATVYVLTAATSLAIERKRLLTLADAVALSASESFSAAEVTFADGSPAPELSHERVERHAREALAQLEGITPIGATLDSATTPDGVTANVVISGRWTPPLAHALLPSGIQLTVSSDARVVFT